MSSPFLQPCIWILRSCEIWELFKMVSFSYLALFPFLFFLLMPVLLCSLRTNCTALTFFRKNQTEALMGKNDKTYFNNWGNPLGNLISWNFCVRLIWIHLHKCPSISPRSCIPRGILKECSLPSASHFCQNLKLIGAILGFCYQVQCRCAGQQVLADGFTLFHSMLFFQGSTTSRSPMPECGLGARHEEQDHYVQNQASYLGCWKLKFMLTSWVIQGHMN